MSLKDRISVRECGRVQAMAYLAKALNEFNKLAVHYEIVGDEIIIKIPNYIPIKERKK